MGTSRIITILTFVGLFIGCKQQDRENSKSSEQSASNSSQPKILHYSKLQLDSILRVAVGDTSSIQNFGTAEILDEGEGEEAYLISKDGTPVDITAIYYPFADKHCDFLR